MRCVIYIYNNGCLPCTKHHGSGTNRLRTHRSCPSLCHRRVPSLVHSSSPSLMGSAVPSALYHAIIASHPPPPLRLLAFTTLPMVPSEWQKCIPLYLAMTSSLVMSAPYWSCSCCSPGLVAQAVCGTCGSASKPCSTTLCMASACALSAHMYTLHEPWPRPLDSAV